MFWTVFTDSTDSLHRWFQLTVLNRCAITLGLSKYELGDEYLTKNERDILFTYKCHLDKHQVQYMLCESLRNDYCEAKYIYIFFF